MATHRNVVRLNSEPPIEFTLIADGTMWPREIHIAGEVWVEGPVLTGGEGYTTKQYNLAAGDTSTERLLYSLQGGS